MAKNGKFQLGLFILGALALLLAMLFFFGMSDLFVRKAHMVTLFDESVQGLAVGSPVKLKGVQIGSVTDVSLRVDDKLVRVDMDIELKSFSNSKSTDSPYRTRNELFGFFRQEIREGLRCRLDYAGITGLRYIEIDYYATPGPAPAPAAAIQVPGELIMPSTPSAFKDIARSLNTSLERISRIRFEEISDNLVASLADISKLLSAPELQDTIRYLKSMAINLDQTTGSVRRVVTEERLQSIAGQAESLLESLRRLADRLNQEAAAADLPAGVGAFRKAADAVTEAADAIGDRRQELAVTLDKLGRTLDSLRELVDYLKNDPSALVRGKQQPPLR